MPALFVGRKRFIKVAHEEYNTEIASRNPLKSRSRVEP